MRELARAARAAWERAKSTCERRGAVGQLLGGRVLKPAERFTNNPASMNQTLVRRYAHRRVGDMKRQCLNKTQRKWQAALPFGVWCMHQWTPGPLKWRMADSSEGRRADIAVVCEWPCLRAEEFTSSFCCATRSPQARSLLILESFQHLIRVQSQRSVSICTHMASTHHIVSP